MDYIEYIDEFDVPQFIIPCGLLGFEDAEQAEGMRCDCSVYQIINVWSDGESSDYSE